LEFRGQGGLWRGQTRVLKYKQTDTLLTTVESKIYVQDTALIDHECVHVHLQKKTDKIWVVHWVPEALRLIISCQKIVCEECRPAMFVYYAPAIHSHKETALKASIQVNIVHNIEGKLGRICPHIFYFP